jgi:hypothetical protein
MAGTLNVDTLKADSNLKLQIASANVAFIDANGLTIVGNSLNVGGTAITSTQLSQLNANGTISAAGIASVNANTITSGTIPLTQVPRLSNVKMPAGSVLQVVSVSKTDVFSTTSQSYIDVTGLSATITPSSATSKILCIVAANAGTGDNAGGVSAAARLVRDSTPIQVGDTAAGYTSTSSASLFGGSTDGNNSESIAISVLDSPATTSAVTYKLQVIRLESAGQVRINALGNDIASQVYSQRSASSITLMEIAA